MLLYGFSLRKQLNFVLLPLEFVGAILASVGVVTNKPTG
jgi:hypothetical protein